MKPLFTNFKHKWLGMWLFSAAIKLTFLLGILISFYWLFIASDRYVSEASVIIRKTDSTVSAGADLPMLLAGVAGVNRADQLLLKEYLLSIDMLKHLEKKLGLREHYSNPEKDIISRLWIKDLERFYRHYLKRTDIEYDDYAGVLRIKAQAYDSPTAKAIADLLVQKGEKYMNHISHELTATQVEFLTAQVEVAQQRFHQASRNLLSYQNQKGLLSPLATAESLTSIIGKLEEQRANLQMQLAALPRSLDADHPTRTMLLQSLAAIDTQITAERMKLANPSGKTLNTTLEKFQFLQMEVKFAEEIYKSALTALEKGRLDAARILEKVSILQTPTLAEYPMQPRRLYNLIVTLIFTSLIVGILKLLEGIVLDHVD